MTTGNNKIWIDLDNSPHVPFFKPIMEELKKRGYTTVLTARDCSQTCELADVLHLKYKRIGKHYGRNKIFKLLGLFLRALQLAPMALHEKPGLAISHGSRSQLILSFILRIPTIEISDYEYATSLPIFRPRQIVVPEAIYKQNLKCGIKSIHGTQSIRSYPGIKEDVYVTDFRPASDPKDELGIPEDSIVVTLRPPATKAHYHNAESERLLSEALNLLSNNSKVRTVILPRYNSQAEILRTQWSEMFDAKKFIIPEKVINGLDLLWYSDLVISGGGTMNREAAALGVPVYSIFRGKIGAVDRYLADSNRLILLESVEDVRLKIKLEHWRRPDMPTRCSRDTLNVIVDHITAMIGAV